MVGPGADHLAQAGGGDDQRRRVGHVAVLTQGLPTHGAVVLVQGRHELRIGAVAADQKQVIRERRRGPRSVLLHIAQAPALPENLAPGVEGRRAEVSEMDVDPVLFQDGRGRGRRVLRVQRGGAFQCEDLDIVEETARIEIEPQGAKRVAGLR